MSEAISLKKLYDGFRDPDTIKQLAKKIERASQHLPRDISIMEVCGGHTHAIMKYGILQLLPKNITFIHGPGCPVCVMPKERIDHAYTLAMQEDVILVTLGDMVKVPGTNGSLQDARAKGADVRFVYSPLDCLQIAKENSSKKVIFFAIGFETTTPMTAALIDAALKTGITNLFYYINHVTVPEVMEVLVQDDLETSKEGSNIDAFLGPSHVSVITGSKIYAPFVTRYHKPVVVAGFEPVDVMASILMIVEQFVQQRCELEVQYKRAVSTEGNTKAQALVQRYFEKDSRFNWRGIGYVEGSSLRLRDAFEAFDAQKVFAHLLDFSEKSDHKLCICGTILRGKAKPFDCTIFGTACTPSTPVGSCMVSSEGACAAYYRYGEHL